MKSKPLGFKLWSVVPCSSGFGQHESNGPVFVRKDSIKPNPALDGLVMNQTGPVVTAETYDGVPVVGMMPRIS